MRGLPVAPGFDQTESDSDSPRARFRKHLRGLGADLTEVGHHLRRAVPQIDTDEEARLAVEELVSHLGGVLGFHTSRDEREGIAIWGSPTGITLVTRALGAGGLAGALAPLAQARDRRLAGTAAPARLVSALGVVCGSRIDWRQIEESLSMRRGLDAVRLVSVDRLLDLAVLRRDHVLAHPDAVVLLRPQGMNADALVELMARRRYGQEEDAAGPPGDAAWWIR